MENIWGIILQSLTVSLTAGLLLLLKGLMADKLSPRWQYGVWSLLALRILIPVSLERETFGSLPLWLEMWKGAVEGRLHSAYASAYEPVALRSVIPLPTGRPVSITDWLFVIYTAGVAVTLVTYLAAWIRTRRLVSRGIPVSAETVEALRETCEIYGLRSCEVVEVSGLPAAFVSGVFRPVLAIPAGKVPDGKVLLHELLHLRFCDVLQNSFWCLLRSLHWFNPFMQLVFDRIGNDMESLCDQRVLERLEGEERREYGEILLGMACDRYARVPGTTSISNGGKNIARRIQAIVRFKKYPRGMGIVALCSVIVLIGPVLVGTAANYGDLYHPKRGSDLPKAMAAARLDRCETMAAALDAYVKGLVHENGVYLALASPLSEHAELERQMRESAEQDGWVAYHLDSDIEGAYAEEYSVYNLKECADGSYEAVIRIEMSRIPTPDGEDYRRDENGDPITGGAIQMRVRLACDEGWVVKECSSVQTVVDGWVTDGQSLEPAICLSGQGETGAILIELWQECEVANSHETSSSFWGSTSRIPDTVDTATEFSYVSIERRYAYDCDRRELPIEPQHAVVIWVATPEKPGGKLEFPKMVDVYTGNGSELSGQSRFSTRFAQRVHPGWNGMAEGGGGFGAGYRIDEILALPEEFYVGIYWDGVLMETICMEVETDD
ncbi:MAG: M56 family metallopeptidase [Lachnospiraceae bacterium]|nr:M56 family metallopeptidase [Lachnospiraceae bacterium]